MWIIAGDLNNIESNEKKWGERDRPDSSFRDFKNFIKDNNLVDLGYEAMPWM